jgi:hypothetical protein
MGVAGSGVGAACGEHDVFVAETLVGAGIVTLDELLRLLRPQRTRRRGDVRVTGDQRPDAGGGAAAPDLHDDARVRRHEDLGPLPDQEQNGVQALDPDPAARLRGHRGHRWYRRQ